MKIQVFILLFALCSLLFAGCRNTKQIVKTETEVKTDVAVNTAKTEEVKTNTNAVSLVAENITETDSTVIEETITELSQPDSAGQQHPEKITQRKITTGKNRKAGTETKTGIVSEIAGKTTETETIKTEATETAKTNSKTIIKQAIPLKIIIGILAFAAIVFVLLKFRNRIFKP